MKQRFPVHIFRLSPIDIGALLFAAYSPHISSDDLQACAGYHITTKLFASTENRPCVANDTTAQQARSPALSFAVPVSISSPWQLHLYRLPFAERNPANKRLTHTLKEQVFRMCCIFRVP
jgi:hypothetical protein